MGMRVSLVGLVVLLGTAPETDQASSDELPWMHVYIEVRARAPRTCTVLVTAYNSEPAQTDDTPHLTAMQTPTREGIVAARWLPLGAQVRIPDYFGDEVLVVEDRMPPRNWCKMDIWHQERAWAEDWGKRFVRVEVLDVPDGFECPVQPPAEHYKCPEPLSDWGRIAARPRANPWQRGS